MLSLRVKLTLYYLAILSAILLLFGIAIFTYLSRSLLITIDESLSYQVKKIESHFMMNADVDVSNLSDQSNEQLLELKPHLLQVIDDNWQIRDEITLPN